MEKRGFDLRILLLCLLVVLAIGVLLWQLAFDGNITGKTSFAPPSYSEFVTESICGNPAVDSISPVVGEPCDSAERTLSRESSP